MIVDTKKTCKDCLFYEKLCNYALPVEELKICNDFTDKNRFVEVEKVKQMCEQIKMRFYYHFEEIIPSIMADEIDSIFNEYCVERKQGGNENGDK